MISTCANSDWTVILDEASQILIYQWNRNMQQVNAHGRVVLCSDQFTSRCHKSLRVADSVKKKRLSHHIIQQHVGGDDQMTGALDDGSVDAVGIATAVLTDPQVKLLHYAVAQELWFGHLSWNRKHTLVWPCSWSGFGFRWPPAEV